MITPPKQPFALVEWDDAHSPAPNESYSVEQLDTIHGYLPMMTAGWILKQDGQGITLAGEYTGEKDYRSLTFIPASLVRDVRVVRVPRRKRSASTKKKAEAQDTASQSDSPEAS